MSFTITLANRSDADKVVVAVQEILDRDGWVTAHEVRSMVGGSTKFVDHKWGWLVGVPVEIRPVEDNLVAIFLPDPVFDERHFVDTPLRLMETPSGVTYKVMLTRLGDAVKLRAALREMIRTDAAVTVADLGKLVGFEQRAGSDKMGWTEFEWIDTFESVRETTFIVELPLPRALS